MPKSLEPCAPSGTVTAPPSKSDTIRAIACALLARGESVLRNPSRSADCFAAFSVAEALGASTEFRGDVARIRGVARTSDERPPRGSPTIALRCGESALCMRMFAPVAALFPGRFRLQGSGSLARRSVSMARVPLQSLGVSFSCVDGRPPMEIEGPLRSGSCRVDGRESSQFLSGLLVALPLADGDSSLEIDSLASKGYADCTVAAMRRFGAIALPERDWSRCLVPGGQEYRATDYAVEGDWSAAAMLLVGGAIASVDGVEIRGLDPASPQPDGKILEILESVGATISPVPDGVRVARGELRAFEADLSGSPDLFPPVAVLAACCDGSSALAGASRLVGKESDRGEALRRMLVSLGAGCGVEGDLMIVRGIGRSRRESLSGAAVETRGDHRIAMAAAIASLRSDGLVTVDDEACVEKSWPGFWDDFASLTPARSHDPDRR